MGITQGIEPGAVLIVVRGMILAHTVPSAVLRVLAAINQDMKALLPKEDIKPEFLCYVLWAFNDSLLELVEKSTHDTRKLETSKLLNFQIPVPSLAEQDRIVAYLNQLQTKVDTMKRYREDALKELNALLPSILGKAFNGEL
ncbi:restriction modification system DNA specificity domain protein [Crinalium epipsammum PCC 9333]|uniref:Restriction modification system DNA specificity domain protein n=1 Tax=Crinalium epipsammum PCC 9333 TaxID=1173022 RepID=K9W203_9CYAN|nr:restriction endonuclease subunit S [Crinalium epipsammum]AFZ13445.1 restriction modification system DNA specificity domain protein [Crinalium epipsammum PCC 9333]